ncbi:MAG: DUF4249 family protein [Cyclobacteriaceae bacterium]
MTLRSSIILFTILLLSDSCVDRIEQDVTFDEKSILVVVGLITDQPGPYTVKLTWALGPNSVLSSPTPVLAKELRITDDLGNTEVMQTTDIGIFQTSPTGMRGTHGRSYTLNITLLDGTIYESSPQLMPLPVTMDSVYFEWGSKLNAIEEEEVGFHLYADAPAVEGQYLRWRFSGNYFAESFPQFNLFGNNCGSFPDQPPIPDPLPCSGYITTGERFGQQVMLGELRQVGPCTCCTCWASEVGRTAILTEDIKVVNNRYQHVSLAFIPFDAWRFGLGKYLARVELMSINEEAYNFWKVVNDQKEGSSSLFQPAVGKTRTNITAVNKKREALGLFYTAAVSKEIRFIDRTDAPEKLADPTIPPATNCVLWRSCTDVYFNSSFDKPSDWN